MKITLACLTVLAIIALLVVAGTHHAHATHAAHNSSPLSKHPALANTKHLTAKSVTDPTTTEAPPTGPQTMKLLPAIGLSVGFVAAVVVFICLVLATGDTTTAMVAMR